MHDREQSQGCRTVISLGSNQGDSVAILQRALLSLALLPDVEPLMASSFYSSTPAYYAEQDLFVNAVCIVQVHQDPWDLLHAIQVIEQQFHRVRSFKNAPRTLDLDIVDMAGLVSDDQMLTLPHPLACERDFIITPLREIAPDFIFAHGVKLSDCHPTVGAVGAVVKPREEVAFS